MNDMTQANKMMWDGLAETHYKNYHIDKLLGGTPLLRDVIRQEVGDVRGKSLVHLLCHIGTDTLSWALLGAKVTGVDISPISLKYARQIAGQMGIQADFIEADVLEVKDRVKDKFDIVFSSTGVLCWMPISTAMHKPCAACSATTVSSIYLTGTRFATFFSTLKAQQTPRPPSRAITSAKKPGAMKTQAITPIRRCCCQIRPTSGTGR